MDVAGADRWPIVIVTLDDPDGSRPATVEEVEAVVAEIGRLQVRLRCFRAVFPGHGGRPGARASGRSRRRAPA
ncbi:hypothetical protein LP422_21930 [Janibacter limosus]|uniref:hypothetical protein n=1 Tax=Janibacter limosus TaxID=53458 RepID=UPI0035D6B984|nr:hypothetical protein LP422_21930 [Janibacter limosus]